MASLRFALAFLSSLLLTTSVCAGGDEDPFIRQVVDNADDLVLSEESLIHADTHFTIFKKKFGKSYDTPQEHDHRFSIFKSNLRRAIRHQKLDPSAAHGVTRFSDLTPREFRNQFLGLNRRLKFPADANKAPILPTKDLPKDFDWRDHGAVTPVKNQVRVL